GRWSPWIYGGGCMNWRRAGAAGWVAVLGLALAPAAARADEEKAAAELQKVGAVLTRPGPGPVLKVQLVYDPQGKQGGPWKDADLRHLAALGYLREVQLESPHINDETLKALAGLKRLQTLHLRGGQITGDGLQALAALPELQELGLYGQKG